MFYPVSKLSCRGMIWYQGCCDTALNCDMGMHVYPKWMSYMVADMRRELGRPDLPFLYCQLAGWAMPPSRPGQPDQRPALREGQRRAKEIIPHAWMAVTLDGSEHEIHNRFKGQVGDRLAALALNHVYGKADVVCESPDYASAAFGADAATITFKTFGSPLVAGPVRTDFMWNAKSNDVIRLVRRSSAKSALEGFTIQGGDGAWHWADAVVAGPDTVKVWAEGVAHPTAVRYNWGAQGFGNLRNAADLPAAPFTTEK